MGDDADKKIFIKNVTGDDIGQLLVGCYFKLKPNGTYTFHDKNDAVKGRDITVDSDFNFRLDEHLAIEWHLDLNSDADEILKGNWRDGKDPSMADGEYQAQAGGSGEEGEINAASAGGY